MLLVCAYILTMSGVPTENRAVKKPDLMWPVSYKA